MVGYSTAIVGKWHLGVGENNTYLPTNYGFDYYMVRGEGEGWCQNFTQLSTNVQLYMACCGR